MQAWSWVRVAGGRTHQKEAALAPAQGGERGREKEGSMLGSRWQGAWLWSLRCAMQEAELGFVRQCASMGTWGSLAGCMPKAGLCGVCV